MEVERVKGFKYMVPRAKIGGESTVTANGFGFLLEEGENVLKLVAAQVCELIKNHEIVCFK